MAPVAEDPAGKAPPSDVSSEEAQVVKQPIYSDSTDKYVAEGINNPSHDNIPGWKQFLFTGWLGDAGSKGDAWMLSSAAQIGQVMLSLPRAVYLTGAAKGLPLMIVIGALSTYTIYLVNTLYIEHKRKLLATGKWYAPGTTQRRQATQYFELVGSLTHPFFGVLTLIVTIIGLLSTGIAQVIACAADTYYIDQSVEKRTWALIWGAILSSIFILPKTFKHLKFLAFIGIIGTFYTSVYIWVTTAKSGNVSSGDWHSGPINLKYFFLGYNVFLSALGGHGMSVEIMDSMWKPSKYARVYPFSTIFTYIVTVPHSVLVVLAYGAANFKNDNVYGVLPDNGWRTSSIVLMLIHQCVAYIIYVGPVFFMAEKLFGVHDSAYWKRILARVPVALFVWLIGVMLPFYSIINAFMGAFAGTLTAFVIPAATHLWYYRNSLTRKNSLRQPPKGTWIIIIVSNIIILVAFAVTGLGFGMWSAIANFVSKLQQLGVFAACYQCKAPAAKAPAPAPAG